MESNFFILENLIGKIRQLYFIKLAVIRLRLKVEVEVEIEVEVEVEAEAEAEAEVDSVFLSF